MLNQVQSLIDNAIGIENYDIGHVFGTNSGGLASLQSPCSAGKARGVTGSASPVNDPFDIDFVAHEMGHQFGGTHTYNNSCGGNRTDATAVEPGSGSSIMAYAGLCDFNVQNNSHDDLHYVNIRDISAILQTGVSTCAAITTLTNQPFEYGKKPSALSTSVNPTLHRSESYPWDLPLREGVCVCVFVCVFERESVCEYVCVC